MELLADVLINTLGAIHPLLMMAGIFILASMLSQIISRLATAVLISPIALVAAAQLGMSPYAMLMCVALAVTNGVLTPVSGAPMLIVMTSGQ